LESYIMVNGGEYYMQLRHILVLAVGFSISLLAACVSGDDVLAVDGSATTATKIPAAATIAAGGRLTKIDPEARPACQALVESDREVGPLLAAYESTAGRIIDWESWLAGTSAKSTSNFSVYPADKPVSICLVSGTFNGPGPDVPEGSTPHPPANRALFLIPEGGTWIYPITFGVEETFSDGNVPKAADDDSTVFTAPEPGQPDR
jgi:hypothetical protein